MATKTVDDAHVKWQGQNVPVRERCFGDVGTNHLRHRERVHKTNVKNKSDGAAVQYSWLQVKIDADQHPHLQCRQKPLESLTAVPATSFNCIESLGNACTNIEQAYTCTLDHMESREVGLVNYIRNPVVLGNTQSRKGCLMPEAASCGGGNTINRAENQNSLDRSGDNAQGKGMGMVLLPCLDVESENSY